MLAFCAAQGGLQGTAAARGLLGGLLALSPTLARSLSNTAEHDRRYVDRMKLTVKAGRGGNGCASFYQAASRGKHATPDGGNGGEGGNVVIQAVSNMKSLAGLQQLYKAEGGVHGTKQRQKGRAGRDTVIRVPVGTVVHRLREEEEGGQPEGEAPGSSGGSKAGSAAARRAGQQGAAAAAAGEAQQELPQWLQRWRKPFSGADYDSSGSSSGDEEEEEEAAAAGGVDAWWDASSGGADAGPAQQQERRQEEGYELLADLVTPGQQVVAARGGAGGRGSAYQARAHPQSVTIERGHPGQVCRLLLELKLLADVGLVGLPSAGKSTLLRALTAATPRVGDYAFTTLSPQLGVIPPPGPHLDPIVVADIPGLIRGAHERNLQNRGLGHHFLRHIERTKALAFVLDCHSGSAGRPGPKAWEQLGMLQEELAAYSPRLAQLPALIVANKVDLLKAPARTLEALQRRTKLAVVAASAKAQATLLPRPQAARSRSVQREAGAAAAAGSARGRQHGGYEWAPGLQPLHFRLALLLHQAGALQHEPRWSQYVAQ